MKKILLLLLTLMLLLPCSAYASGPWSFGFDSPCGSPSAYGYSQQYQRMDSDKFTVQIRHSVAGEGASAGFTNLLGIYEYGSLGHPPMGSKWSVPNGIYDSLRVSLQKNHSYAPCGRANTKYYDLYGLTTVRMEGQWRAK